MQLDADWLLSCFVRKSDQSDSSLQYLKLSVALAINFLLPVPAFDINWKNRYSSLASSLLVTRLSLEAQIINNTQHRELRSSIADSQNCKTPKNSIALGNVTSMPNFSILYHFVAVRRFVALFLSFCFCYIIHALLSISPFLYRFIALHRFVALQHFFYRRLFTVFTSFYCNIILVQISFSKTLFNKRGQMV